MITKRRSVLAHSGITLVAIATATTAASAGYVADSSFEAASCPPNWFAYNPGGSPWTFLGNSGVTRPPSPFYAPTPPSGVQVAFLQTNVGPSGWGEISQSITLPGAGSYTLSYLHAGRHSFIYPGDTLYDVVLDSTVIATMSTASFQPFTPVSIPFSAGGGAHTLTFRFNAAQPEGDYTAFFDNVTIVPMPGAAALGVAGLLGLAAFRRR